MAGPMRLHPIPRWICLVLLSFSCRAISVETSEFILPGSDERARLQPAPAAPEKIVRLEQIASGLTMPLYLSAAPGDPRLFVLEKPGRIMIIERGIVLPTPFLDLSESIDFVGERGLLGLAFAPDYRESGRFYACYTDASTKATVVSRFQVSKDRNIAIAASQERLLEIPQPEDRGDHKAGWIGFRPGEPDHLYIATGDGGGSNDPDEVSQDLQSLRGKILRIDVRESGEYQFPRATLCEDEGCAAGDLGLRLA
jgi:glucose/arabinose dehydrogenase